MSKLTEMTCKTAKPKEKAYKLFDGGGLYLEIRLQAASYGGLNIDPLMARRNEPLSAHTP